MIELAELELAVDRGPALLVSLCLHLNDLLANLSQLFFISLWYSGSLHFLDLLLPLLRRLHLRVMSKDTSALC